MLKLAHILCLMNATISSALLPFQHSLTVFDVVYFEYRWAVLGTLAMLLLVLMCLRWGQALVDGAKAEVGGGRITMQRK